MSNGLEDRVNCMERSYVGLQNIFPFPVYATEPPREKRDLTNLGLFLLTVHIALIISDTSFPIFLHEEIQRPRVIQRVKYSSKRDNYHLSP
jgi:hypothetical protein